MQTRYGFFALFLLLACDAGGEPRVVGGNLDASAAADGARAADGDTPDGRPDLGADAAGGAGGVGGAGGAGGEGGVGGAPEPRCGDGACSPGEDCGSCAADCGCAAGEVCDGNVCAPEPDCAGGCPDGQVCSDGACVDVPSECPCPVETYCDLAQGRCVVGCLDDTDCDAGRICFADQRTCRDGCREDAQCGGGRICEGDVCRPGCRDDDSCGPGRICQDLTCSDGCREDAECGGGSICADNSCREGCRRDAQCGAGRICQDTRCRAGCRDDDACERGQICVDLACRDGCRDHGDCPLENLCRDTRCVAGCATDEGCRDGDICEDGECRAGCRAHTECDEDQFCDGEAFTCTVFEGSGRCWRDSHCASGEACNLRTLVCEPPRILGRECDSGACRDCGSGDQCINDRCVRRGDGELCGLDRTSRCGQNYTCAPLTLTCTGLSCEGQNRSCRQGVGLRGAIGSTCQSTSLDNRYCFCTDMIGDDCNDDRNCQGLRCVDGRCRIRAPCETNADCLGPYGCVAGACAPYYEVPCVQVQDCPARTRCIAEVGRCANP